MTPLPAIAAGPMTPVPHRVVGRHDETGDTVTIRLEPVTDALPPPAPGQFHMLWAFGVGEAPISVAGGTGTPNPTFTIRRVGAVTRALAAARPGDELGVRGPFGTGWGAASGGRRLVIAGGLGLAPVRPLVAEPAAGAPGATTLVVGARSPAELLYRDEISGWSAREDLEVQVTVDAATRSWRGHVGVVTRLVERLDLDPTDTSAVLCGPEVMMRVTARALLDRGLDPARIEVSLERNMHCAVGHCGHCQLGPVFVCKDGPVLGWDRAEPLLGVRER